MIASRGAALLRASKLLTSQTGNFKQVVRNSGHHHWNYRTAGTEHSKVVLYAAEGVMAFAWWWILWHLYTEPGHIFGEFEYPDAAKWTDEELGIPSE